MSDSLYGIGNFSKKTGRSRPYFFCSFVQLLFEMSSFVGLDIQFRLTIDDTFFRIRTPSTERRTLALHLISIRTIKLLIHTFLATNFCLHPPQLTLEFHPNAQMAVKHSSHLDFWFEEEQVRKDILMRDSTLDGYT